MNGLEHLATLPAYMINLDRSTDRWATAQNRAAPYVRELVRVPGVDGRELSDQDIEEFDEAIRSNPLLPVLEKSKAWLRGTLGCYLGHIEAINAGVTGGEPFLVLEDDAGFYRNDLAEATPSPTEQGVYIWGGALLNGGYMDHERRYQSWEGETNSWTLIGDPRHRHVATAYEFTDVAIAEEWLRYFTDNPHATDFAWQVPMSVIPTYAPAIEVIQQDPLIKSVRATSSLKNKYAGGLFLQSILGGNP